MTPRRLEAWVLANYLTLTGVQTLTNKTMTSPVLNSPDIVNGVEAGLNLGAADVTLSAAQKIKAVLEVSTGHAANAIIAPAENKIYMVVNNDAVNNALIKKAAGVAVTIPPSTAAIVYYNGTNYVMAASNQVTLGGAQVLTNKTLTTPIIASLYQDAGKTKLMTVPNTASDTIAALAATQIFTNKTVDSAGNYLKNVPLALVGSITRAEMITGKVLLAGATGKTIRILGYNLIVTGAFNGGAGTSMVIQDTAAAPVIITTILKAALTDGAKISNYGLAIANVTDGAGMTGNLTAAKGIAVAADAAWDAGTSVSYVIMYQYV